MMRNLIVLGCTGLLAFGLSVSTFAGLPTDTDSDGFMDGEDRCRLVPDGPFGGDCAGNQDADLDGYGNACDTDTNNDGATGLDDVAVTLAAQAVGGTDSNLDFNCDGATGLDDVAQVLAGQAVGETPGPSGLNCLESPPLAGSCPEC